MRDALIVSTARTPLGKSYRGAFNNTTAPTMAGWAIEEAVKRSGVDPAKVDDVIMGAALQQGTSHGNIARNAALAAGLPVTVSGMRFGDLKLSGEELEMFSALLVATEHVE